MGGAMAIENCCHGHGLTRAGFLGRGATVAGAVLAGSAGLPGVANADGDACRRVPRPGEVPDTPLARAVRDFAASAYPKFLRDHCQRSYELAVLIAAAGHVK